MGTLNDIRQKLSSGSTASQLIKEGYAKSSVTHAARKLRNTQLGTPTTPVSDELQELRQRKEIVKLQKEIADLEAGREGMPDRLSKLEAEVGQLNQQLPDLLANCYGSVYLKILSMLGWTRDGAREEVKTATDDYFKHLLTLR